MITKFKIFENSNNDVIYRCADFVIKEDFTYESMFIASDIIRQLPVLIKDNHHSLNDNNFKNLEITQKYKSFFHLHMSNFDSSIFENLKKYKSGLISHFLYYNKRTELEKIDSNVYGQLVLKYYPIIDSIIEKSETIGDVIPEYKKLVQDINNDLEFFTKVNKYNI